MRPTANHPHSHRQLRHAALTGLALASLLSAVAQTADADAVEVLDPFVVSAENEPGNFKLAAQDVAKIQALTIGDLLANESTLAVGGGSAVAQKIYVRGFEDTLLNVSLDGAPQAGELYHHQGRVQIEPEFIKTLELDAGAGVATNGAGALTGALRIETKDAFDLLRPDQRVGALLKAAAGLNGDDHFKGLASAFARLNDNLGLVVSYTRKEGDDYADGHGNLASPTGFDHERGYAKLTARFGDHTADLAFEKLHDTGTYFERPHMSNFTGAFVLSDHELDRETLTYNHRFDPDSDLVDLRATAYWTANDFANHRITTGALYGAGDFSSAGLDLRNTSLLGDHALTYGVDYRNDRVTGTQQATPPAFWGSSEQDADVWGLYAQDNWKLASSLKLTAGLRFDSYAHEVDRGVGAGVRNSDTGFSPNAGLEWRIVDGLTARVSYALAFRGITIREAFFSGLYEHREGLKSETADNVELGLAYEKDGFFARATLFRQHIESYIDAVYVGSGTVWGYWGNVGDAKVEGYEAELGKRWQHLLLAVGVWNSDNSLNGAPLTDASLGLGTSLGRTWTARAEYSLPKHALTLGARGRLVESERNTISANAPDKPGYFVADFHATWQPFRDDRLTVAASLNNASDKFYYDHATYGFINRNGGTFAGFPAKGRELILSTSYKF